MFEIHYLADRPEFIDACAAWGYGRWGVKEQASSLQKALDVYRSGAQKDGLPLTLIAVHAENNVPIGMGSLWEKDSKYWTAQTPWIASLFTHYKWRGCGVASAMLARLEAEGRRLGVEEIYLMSGSAAGFYPQFGYEEIDSRLSDTNVAGKETLFSKRLQA